MLGHALAKFRACFGKYLGRCWQRLGQTGLDYGGKLPPRGTGGFGSTGPDGCASESVSALAAAAVSSSSRIPDPRQSKLLSVQGTSLKILHLLKHRIVLDHLLSHQRVPHHGLTYLHHFLHSFRIHQFLHHVKGRVIRILSCSCLSLLLLHSFRQVRKSIHHASTLHHSKCLIASLFFISVFSI